MNEFNDIEDIEQLLKPQCEFHASDTLKDEVIAKAKEIAETGTRPRRVSIFAWLAAACVAGIIGLFLMPPEQSVSEAPVVAKVEVKPHVTKRHEKIAVETVKEDVTKATRKKAIKEGVAKTETPTTEEPIIEQVESSEEPIMLTETDIPITRPENLIDTPEDLVQIARLEKQAFINRMREQVEIAKAELIQSIPNSLPNSLHSPSLREGSTPLTPSRGSSYN